MKSYVVPIFLRLLFCKFLEYNHKVILKILPKNEARNIKFRASLIKSICKGWISFFKLVDGLWLSVDSIAIYQLITANNQLWKQLLRHLGNAFSVWLPSQIFRSQSHYFAKIFHRFGTRLRDYLFYFYFQFFRWELRW